MRSGSSRSVPAAAPGRLGMVQDFLNTLHVERGTDELGNPATAYVFLPPDGPDLPPPGPEDLARLRVLRRELRARCGDGPRDDDAFADLAAQAPLRLAPGDDGPLELTPTGEGNRAVPALLLAAVYDAERDGTWSRLKICHHDGCRWVFYDESRSRTGTWCAMGICGNRTKVAAYRRRTASVSNAAAARRSSVGRPQSSASTAARR
ncbi:CGNR zinc finger domain-containing protein [Paractinoplanes toevensis]|uniref:Zinc finger CGNR domain-containing protein n=1 Tax=Paractinoplanes toevensis TaxID=571911 RepID=A0A919WBA0_9ACTN|nr:CGNR zinc finger domain-containing protein [Actinoplanes toevensis]GIM97042.1 hypothetical protein Ato02nite_088350 [Actinoplanes toevensis]